MTLITLAIIHNTGVKPVFSFNVTKSLVKDNLEAFNTVVLPRCSLLELGPVVEPHHQNFRKLIQTQSYYVVSGQIQIGGGLFVWLRI
jgi:hypothetical protein